MENYEVMKQQVIFIHNNFDELDAYFKHDRENRILLVCGDSVKKFRLGTYFDSIEKRMGIHVIKFSNFCSNPSYESVVDGVRVFKENGCNMIVAVGGGSAMDVAKCIKLFCNMDDSISYLKQKIVKNEINLAVAPTTAGTGSESTKFAVIYENGEKQSIEDESCIPSVVIIDPTSLKSLPDYQRKSSMMDAFCHALESYWSIHSTEESRRLSEKAIKLILDNQIEYLDNLDNGNFEMLRAANFAGKAINITQTTAGHAMCYKLTSLYGIAHGHAAALCVSVLFPYMVEHIEDCADPRGKEYLTDMFEKLARVMRFNNAREASKHFADIVSRLGLESPRANDEDFEELKSSVNLVRLKNNPIKLDSDTLDSLYHRLLKN